MAKKRNGKSNGNSNVNGKTEFSKRNKSLLGYNAIFTPEVIDDIHIKTQLGRYRMRGMALMKKIPTFDDLVAMGSEEIAIRSILPQEIDTYDPFDGEVKVWQI